MTAAGLYPARAPARAARARVCAARAGAIAIYYY